MRAAIVRIGHSLCVLIVLLGLAGPGSAEDLKRNYEGVTLSWSGWDPAWQEIAPGVFQRNGQNGVLGLRYFGVEGLTWKLNKLRDERQSLLTAPLNAATASAALKRARSIKALIGTLADKISQLKARAATPLEVSIVTPGPGAPEDLVVKVLSDETEEEEYQQSGNCTLHHQHHFYLDTPCSTHSVLAEITCSSTTAGLSVLAEVSSEKLASKECYQVEEHGPTSGTHLEASVSCGGYWWSWGHSQTAISGWEFDMYTSCPQ